MRPLALETTFARPAPLALDIGFGEAAFLVALAKLHPEWNVLGLEIRPHLIELAQRKLKAEGVTNAHPVLANANLHLPQLIPDDTVVFVAINFPDPWYKKRHQKRRVLRESFLTALRPKLVPGAQVHLMTDYQPLAQEALELLEATPWLANAVVTGRMADHTTTGISTERELKHTRRQEPIYRLHFVVAAGS